MPVVHVLAFLAGLSLVIFTLRSGIRTFIMPRSVNDSLTRAVFNLVFAIFLFAAPPTRDYEYRDRVFSFFAPVSLITLPLVWMTVVLLGYMGMFWSLGIDTLDRAFIASGSSLVTLGFAIPTTTPGAILTFSEAAIGLLLVALLIAYLPTIYSSFSRREVAVTMLEVRAGSPPSAVELISRFHALGRLEKLTELWEDWETWFAEIEETHTSLGMLALFRSTQPNHSWVTASGAVLDGASLMASTVDAPRDPQAELCIRAGYLALRYIADFFDIPYVPVVSWDDPISVTREEYDDACSQLETAGVPLKSDREKAWRDFVGWRVNYDMVLLELARLTIAPYAPWISDRARMPAPRPNVKA
ncbi:MAG: hypothetical protein JWO59_90 [Chloroflexi bacterium]|nr:hypothetical protein [Chloroflexota bacterium]